MKRKGNDTKLRRKRRKEEKGYVVKEEKGEVKKKEKSSRNEVWKGDDN